VSSAQALAAEVARLRSDAVQSIKGAQKGDELEGLRTKLLGKKGSLTSLLKDLKSVEENERRDIGSLLNTTKLELEQLIASRTSEISSTGTQPDLYS
jgi:phenylalanyl-tRNA synthetase alpha chain